MKFKPLSIAGQEIPPGTHTTLNIELPRLYTHTETSMPVHVIRGKKDGPCLFISAALHGDEINGIEIIRRLLRQKTLKQLKGTLITVPIVNVYGVIQHSRYLPDRRDLNRCFPGSETGPLASRIANLFMTEIVSKCDAGIDLHTGALHRSNLPQIRANLDHEETSRLAHCFGVPVIIDASVRDGSLRQAAAERGITTLLYEAGEALRFDELCIRAGLRGIMNVMRTLDMLPKSTRPTKVMEPFVASSSSWIRAPESGLLRAVADLGNRVGKGDLLGYISDPFGINEVEVISTRTGIIIGRTHLPLVNEGDALYHVAHFSEDSNDVARTVEDFQQMHYIEADMAQEPPIT